MGLAVRLVSLHATLHFFIWCAAGLARTHLPLPFSGAPPAPTPATRVVVSAACILFGALVRWCRRQSCPRPTVVGHRRPAAVFCLALDQQLHAAAPHHRPHPAPLPLLISTTVATMAYVRPGATTATHRPGTDDGRRALLFGDGAAGRGGSGGGSGAGGRSGPAGGRYPQAGGSSGAGGDATTEQLERDNSVRVDRLTGGVQALKEVRAARNQHLLMQSCWWNSS